MVECYSSFLSWMVLSPFDYEVNFHPVPSFKIREPLLGSKCACHIHVDCALNDSTTS